MDSLKNNNVMLKLYKRENKTDGLNFKRKLINTKLYLTFIVCLIRRKELLHILKYLIRIVT